MIISFHNSAVTKLKENYRVFFTSLKKSLLMLTKHVNQIKAGVN